MKQHSLPLEPPRSTHVATVATPTLVVEFHDWSPIGPCAPLDTIPAWLRLPGEPGFLELDRFLRPRKNQ